MSDKSSKRNAIIKKIDSSDELDKLKQAATLLTNRDVIGAQKLYTQTLSTCKDKKILYTIFVKRSDCLVQLNEFEKALKDLQQAIILNKEGIIPYLRSLRCYISLGQLEDAEDYLKKEVFSGCRIITKYRSDIQKIRNVQDAVNDNSKDYQQCLDLLNSGLDLAPASVDLLVVKVKYLVLLKKFEEAKEVDNLINKRCGKVLKVLEAFTNYYECNFDKCDFEMIRKNINSKVVQTMSKKATDFKTNFEHVKNEIRAKNYSEAVSILYELFEYDDTNRKAFQKVCEMLLECYKRMNDQDENVVKSDDIYLCPLIVKYYTNRCDSNMSKGNYESAILDAMKAVDVDPSFWEGYSQAINCFLIVGNIKQARNYIDKMQKNITGIDSIQFNEIPKVEKLEHHHAQIVKLMDEKNFDESLKHLEAALKIATECKQYDFWLAECLIMVSKDDESQKLLTKYPKEPYAVFLKGLNAFINNNNINKSLEYFQEALKLDPEFTKASHYKKTVTEVRKLELDAIRCSTSNDVRGAIAAYSSIIDFKHESIRLKFKAFLRRAELYFNSQNFLKAFEDCSKALKLKFNEKDEIFIDALILRAKIHCKQKEFEDAIVDCDEVLRIVGSASKYKGVIDVLKKDAKNQSSLHRDVRNYHEILKIPQNSSMAIIKKAFKNLSLLYHSDKHPGATAVEKKKLEIRFREVKNAFERLKGSA